MHVYNPSTHTQEVETGELIDQTHYSTTWRLWGQVGYMKPYIKNKQQCFFVLIQNKCFQTFEKNVLFPNSLVIYTFKIKSDVLYAEHFYM